MIPIDPRLGEVCDAYPFPLLFATVSGAHLYGFASADSDFDLRGVHVLPLRDVIGLGKPRETVESMRPPRDAGDLDLDLVTHDVAKFLRLVLSPNGYVLEQLFSPLVVRTTPEHAELKELASRCITREHARHYLGFAANQWKLFLKESPKRVKPLLYVYRVVLTGIHLMRTGRIEANLGVLNLDAKLPYVDDLIARKTAGRESEALDESEVGFHLGEYERWIARLEDARDRSTLREKPNGLEAANDLLIRIRTRGFQS